MFLQPAGRYSIIVVNWSRKVGTAALAARPCVSDYRSYDFADAALKLDVVGDRAAYRDFAGQVRMNTTAYQLRRVDQQSGRYALLKPVAFEVAHFLADQHQIARGLLVHIALVHQNGGFQRGRRIVKFEPD